MNDFPKWICVFPSFVVGAFSLLFGVMLLLGAFISHDDEGAGCGLLLAIFGVVILAALAFARFV